MQTASITKAIVQKASGKAVKSQFNDEMRINIVVQKQDGTTETIWGNENSIIRTYRQGDAIEYTKTGNQYVFFNTPNAQNTEGVHRSDTAQNMPQNTEGVHIWKEPTENVKKSMLKYIDFQSQVYLYAFQKIGDEMKNMALKDEQIKDITTCVFIQTQRKFNF